MTRVINLELNNKQPLVRLATEWQQFRKLLQMNRGTIHSAGDSEEIHC